MGKSMAGHLIKKGHKLCVYNRTKSKADDLVAMGAEYCETPKAVASQVDYLFLMLGFPHDVEKTVYDPETGVFDSMKPNSYLIDHTTSSPALAQRIAKELKEKKGVLSLDAPVSGGDVGAKSGQLVTMIGGEPEAIDHCMPLLNCFSRQVMNMGGPGQG